MAAAFGTLVQMQVDLYTMVSITANLSENTNSSQGAPAQASLRKQTQDATDAFKSLLQDAAEAVKEESVGIIYACLQRKWQSKDLALMVKDCVGLCILFIFVGFEFIQSEP